MRADAITLDTCVLEHFFNPDWNGDGHISALLGKLLAARRSLCFDDQQRLAGEMHHRLSHYKQHREFQNFGRMLMGLLTLPKIEIKVEQGSSLMDCLSRNVGRGTEASDLVVVFVACATDTLLVSNNGRHITDRAARLRDCASAHAGTTPDFWNSATANAIL